MGSGHAASGLQAELPEGGRKLCRIPAGGPPVQRAAVHPYSSTGFRFSQH